MFASEKRLFASLNKRLAAFAVKYPRLSEYVKEVIHVLITVGFTDFGVSVAHLVYALAPWLVVMIALILPFILLLVNDGLRRMGMVGFTGIVDSGLTQVVQQGEAALQAKENVPPVPLVPPVAP